MEEVTIKWCIWLLLNAQVFAELLKELNIKDMAVVFCFPIVPQGSCFTPISRMTWKFPGSPLKEEPSLMRTGCSETEKQKPTLFNFRKKLV